jgi:hypothetical protein
MFAVIVAILLFSFYALIVMFCVRNIYENGAPYIDRYYLLPPTPWGRVFLQHIRKRDDNPNLHNHPWPAWSLVLWGGYYETRWAKPPSGTANAPGYFRHLRRGSINRLQANVYHRIHRVESNTWTLFFHGRRLREWGFLVKGRFVKHDAPRSEGGRGR